MTFVLRLPRIIGALLMAAALAACSAVKLGYNALDDVAYLWLDGYFSFSEDQTPMVRGELERLHAWHRTNELARLAEVLGRMEQLAMGPISAPQACAFVPQFQARMLAVAEQAEPLAAAVAVKLSPRQLRQLQRKSNETNRKFRREWVDIPVAEQRDKRFKESLDRLESIYGRLDEPQRAVLRAGMERSIYDPARILAERQRRQQDLQQTLRRLAGSQAPPAEARAVLRAYVERVMQSPDPAYRPYQKALVEEGCQVFAAVHEATTPAQREQAARRLRAYQRDLRELSGAS
jgi:hypothetical protein